MKRQKSKKQKGGNDRAAKEAGTNGRDEALQGVRRIYQQQNIAEATHRAYVTRLVRQLPTSKNLHGRFCAPGHGEMCREMARGGWRAAGPVVLAWFTVRMGG
ncbi:uncharacterized protein SPSK_00945 [Sporothrix schenckii 1099-18]|uniref:Uncharacterized protein n=1 Tax=Sporothrix schenckii 1099-18 TaxID=1397361 RepID=A0A0F2LVZ1_SPOSC|nr:uncharacterized protein SPSK_00945 [Sporothrix schenckii 1099-18]KJR81642.1 hypothetical protein SPSK_00945 [Sporothrix schenckii 1099-18]